MNSMGGGDALQSLLLADDARVEAAHKDDPLLCSICQLEIVRRLPWFKCHDCSMHSSRQFFICKVCFSHGKEFGSHQNDHSYQVMVSPSLSIHPSTTTPHWTAGEEVQLLDGIEKYGLGNWEAVSQYISTPDKDAQECERHYTQTFLLNEEVGVVNDASRKRVETGRKEQCSIDIVLKDRLASLSHQPGADIVGYMPLRDFYDVEFLNNAESQLTELHLTPMESERIRSGREWTEDLRKKMQVVKLYNRKLQERKRRKRFVTSKRLLAWREKLRAWKQASQVERDIRDKLAPLERFSSHQQHEMLVYGLVREVQLRDRLEKVQREGFVPLRKTRVETASQKVPQGKVFDQACGPVLGLDEVQYGGLKRALLQNCQGRSVRLCVSRSGRRFHVKAHLWA